MALTACCRTSVAREKCPQLLKSSGMPAINKYFNIYKTSLVWSWKMYFSSLPYTKVPVKAFVLVLWFCMQYLCSYVFQFMGSFYHKEVIFMQNLTLKSVTYKIHDRFFTRYMCCVSGKDDASTFCLRHALSKTCISNI